MDQTTPQATKPTQPTKPKKVVGKPARPDKILPTERIKFDKQMDLLRAYSAASGTAGKPVGNKDVAGIVKMQETTISLANAFFTATGLLQRHPDGGFVPSAEVNDFALAHKWNPDTASHRLSPLLSRTWFAVALVPKLSFQPLEESEAITALAHAASAPPDYKNQLRLLIDYLEAAGIVQRDGGFVKLAKMAQERHTEPATTESRESAPGPARTGAVSTTFAAQPSGVVQFGVSVKVDMAELSTWSAERITAFFGGIAQVLAAKGAIEKDSGKSGNGQ